MSPAILFEGHLPAENEHKFEHLINGYLYIQFLDFFFFCKK